MRALDMCLSFLCKVFMSVALQQLAIATIASKQSKAGLTASTAPHTNHFCSYFFIELEGKAVFTITIIQPLLLMVQPFDITAIRLKRLIQKLGMYCLDILQDEFSVLSFIGLVEETLSWPTFIV